MLEEIRLIIATLIADPSPRVRKDLIRNLLSLPPSFLGLTEKEVMDSIKKLFNDLDEDVVIEIQIFFNNRGNIGNAYIQEMTFYKYLYAKNKTIDWLEGIKRLANKANEYECPSPLA